MIKTYTYKLKPNKNVKQKFEHWIGITTYVYNLAKETKEQAYKKGLKLSAFDLNKQMAECKKDFPFLKEVGSQTLQGVIFQMEDAFQKFFKGARYPKWLKRKNNKSLLFTAQGIKTTHNGFKLASFGVVKVFNFKVPKGILKSSRLVQEADGIYLKISVQEESSIIVENQNECGIDMGIKYFLVNTDGIFIDNPKHLFKKLSELRVQQRRLSRMKKFGSNWKKQVNVIQLLHQKVSRSRKDFLHKESTKLSKEYKTVFVENLNISGMSKNTKLSKHILDCSWGTFFQFLEYKTNVVKVNPAYTSQECNRCGHKVKENRKSQSIFECVSCGHTDNADLNASYNILQRGQSLIEAKVTC